MCNMQGICREYAGSMQCKMCNMPGYLMQEYAVYDMQCTMCDMQGNAVPLSLAPNRNPCTPDVVNPEDIWSRL